MKKLSVKGCPVLISCEPTNAANLKEMEIEYSTGASESNRKSYRFNSESVHRRSQWGSEKNLTVSVQNLYKSYEVGKPVLSNLCMSVEEGTIYGLLGSSGCGKSSVLSCIVGLRNWDSGEILLFNKRPNGPPGNRVGFMPQDIALYDQISIRETIGYYGRLYGMAEDDIEKQWLWLVDFLQLPSKFKLIKDLSGGQQRRVSLAVTLVHSPQLLILDEPTVGLDPLLRESIWNHLLKMIQARKTTIIITTHYIEEARFSNRIGVMRKGRLLVEESPQALLQQYECNLLEQVVLKLCHKDEQALKKHCSNSLSNNIPDVVISDGKRSRKSSKNSYNVYEKFQENWRLSNQRKCSMRMNRENNNHDKIVSSKIHERVRALSTVIWLLYLRHSVFMSIVLFLPTIQMVLTLAVIGSHPKNLHFGVVNEDTLSYDTCFNKDTNIIDDQNFSSNDTMSSCNFQQLSCILVEELTKSSTLTLVPIQSHELARHQVVQGDLWGYFAFPKNYSQHLANLVVEQKFAQNETLEGSRVHLTMDMSNYLGAALAISDTFKAYEGFAGKFATSCGFDPREFQLPMMYQEPVFGSNDATYQQYVIPIVILTVIYEIPMLLTSIMFIGDRKQGTLDRARVAGLRFKEVMLSHFITQCSVIIGQTAICSIVMHFLYDFRVAGCYWHYFLLIVLGGLSGESLGLLFGVLFQEEVEAVMLGLLIGPTLLLYEGALWPLQGMTATVRTIARTSPTTLMVESIRAVVYKGVGLLHGAVWPGIAVILGWMVAVWVISILVFLRKQK